MLKKGQKIYLSVLGLYIRYGTELKYARISKDPHYYDDYAIINKDGDIICYHGQPVIIANIMPECIWLLNEFGKPFSLTPEEIICGAMLQGETVCLRFGEMFDKLAAKNDGDRISRFGDYVRLLQLSDRHVYIVEFGESYDAIGSMNYGYGLWVPGERELTPVRDDVKEFMINAFDYKAGKICVTSIANPKISIALSTEEFLELVGGLREEGA